MLNLKVGEAIFLLRRRRKMTQAQLAGSVGIPAGRVSKMENHKPDVLIKDVQVVLAYFGYTMEMVISAISKDQDEIN